jgi:hypothetical protein
LACRRIVRHVRGDSYATSVVFEHVILPLLAGPAPLLQAILSHRLPGEENKAGEVESGSRKEAEAGVTSNGASK